MIYGYFDSPEQEEPVDPGLQVPCPICNNQLGYKQTLKTISLMKENDSRSYFYRVHKSCYENVPKEDRVQLDSAIIDAVAKSKELN